MRKLVTFGLATLLVLSLTTVLFANDAKEMKGPHMKVSGEVVSVDAATRTLTVREKMGDKNNDWTFTVEDSAKVMVAGKDDSLDHLKAGDLISVKYHNNGETHMAVLVESHPAAEPK
jgi:hypothetical protein